MLFEEALIVLRKYKGAFMVRYGNRTEAATQFTTNDKDRVCYLFGGPIVGTIEQRHLDTNAGTPGWKVYPELHSKQELT